MDMHIIAALCLVLMQSCLFNGQRVRPCTSVPTRHLSVENVQHSYRFIANEQQVGNVSLLLNISWELDNTLGEGEEIDGFLIRLLNVVDGTQVPPVDTCSAGYAWLNAENCTDDYTNQTVCPEQSNNRCLCPVANCSLLDDTCIGTLDAIDFYNFNSDTRSVVFDASFRKGYSVEIQPYYRQYVARNAGISIAPASDCHGLASTQFGFDQSQAITFCCNIGFPQFEALNPSIQPYQSSSWTEESSKIIVSWLPPINQTDEISVIVAPATNITVQNITRLLYNSSTITSECYIPEYQYQVVVEGFQLDVDYTIYISSFAGSYCRTLSDCRTRDLFFTFRNLDICEFSNSTCDKTADCFQFQQQSLAYFSHFTCTSETNVTEIDNDMCLDSNICTNMYNSCTTISANIDQTNSEENLNLECVCAENEIGDGRINGTRCRNGAAPLTNLKKNNLFLAASFISVFCMMSMY